MMFDFLNSLLILSGLSPVYSIHLALTGGMTKNIGLRFSKLIKANCKSLYSGDCTWTNSAENHETFQGSFKRFL